MKESVFLTETVNPRSYVLLAPEQLSSTIFEVRGMKWKTGLLEAEMRRSFCF